MRPYHCCILGETPSVFRKIQGKIIGVIHAALLPDFFNGLIGKTQQLFGVGDAHLLQVGADGQSETAPEDPGEIELVDIKLLSKIVWGDLLGIVLIQIILHRLHVSAAVLLSGWAPGFQLSSMRSVRRDASSRRFSYP